MIRGITYYFDINTNTIRTVHARLYQLENIYVPLQKKTNIYIAFHINYCIFVNDELINPNNT